MFRVQGHGGARLTRSRMVGGIAAVAATLTMLNGGVAAAALPAITLPLWTTCGC